MKRLGVYALFSLISVPLFYAQAQSVGLPGLPTITDQSISVPDGTAEQANVLKQVMEGDILLSITPPLPGPSIQATASLSASSIDLNRSTITWSVNGSKVASGLGLTSARFTTGAVGTKTTVSAAISSPQGNFTKSMALDNGAVDLLWQGGGYTPPFYEGRTLWGRQTRISFFAIPHVSGSTSNLIYRWSLDGVVVDTSSGVGKSSFSVYDSVLGLTRTVTVDVMSSSDTVLASASIDISATNPSLLVYENSPLYGYVFEREAGNIATLRGKEVTFASFPYFFGTQKHASQGISYQWLVNGTNAETGSEVTYRTPDASGRSAISLHAENPTQYLQTADKSFLVQFSNE